MANRGCESRLILIQVKKIKVVTMSLSTDQTSPPADTQITHNLLQGIVREHITFENSQIGEVETVNDDDEVSTENLSENRVSSNVDDGSSGMPPLDVAMGIQKRHYRS